MLAGGRLRRRQRKAEGLAQALPRQRHGQITRAHAFAVMAARIAGRLHLINFAIAQARKPGDAAKGAEVGDIFRHQPAREGFIIRQAPIRCPFRRVRLMRGLHQHQRMAGPMGGQHHAEETGQRGEGTIRVLLQ